MMTFKHFFLFVSLFAGLALNAQDTKLENTLLWKITGDDIQPSYLYGTIHATCEVDLNERIMRALEETDNLVLELDMDDPQMMSKMMQAMMSTDGEKISDYLNDEEQEKLNNFLMKHASVQLSMVDSQKPLMLSSLLIPATLGCPMKSYEEALMKVVKEQEEEVLGLEEVEEQLAVFDRIPMKVQVKDLMRTVDEGMEKAREGLQKMQVAYQQEDLAKLIEVMNDPEAGAIMEYQEILLDERNVNWIERIQKIAADTPSFFGVGAGHLAGEKGVIQLLRDQGYTVTPVMP